MTRTFSARPLPGGVLDDLVRLAARAPSVGKTQGWHLVVLEGDDTARFWDITLPPSRRESFRWQGLLAAPVILLPLADPKAYTDRYSEPDKVSTGLGAGPEAWPVPYWTIDASMSMMTLLLGAEDAGLGALLFGVFTGESCVAGIFERSRWPRTVGRDRDRLRRRRCRTGWQGDQCRPPGRTPDEIIHRGGW